MLWLPNDMPNCSSPEIRLVTPDKILFGWFVNTEVQVIKFVPAKIANAKKQIDKATAHNGN
jgi:hypothetical protein